MQTRWRNHISICGLEADVSLEKKINEYIETWENRGYSDGIPDDAPQEIVSQGLAPCYRLICETILKNDMHAETLGYSSPYSHWYSAIKRNEIEQRNNK